MHRQYPGIRIAVAAAAAIMAVNPVVAAHPEIEARITAVTSRIAAEPGDAALYFKRGELYRQHEAWDAALADYERAMARDPAMAAANLARARVLLKGGWPYAAEAIADDYLTERPGDAIALLTRGRARALVGRALEGAGDLAEAASILTNPMPDLSIERARMLAAAGGEHVAEAVEALDDAIRVFGPLITLELAAVEIEAGGGRLDAALARLDAVTNRSPRRESYLVMRAKLLETAGRTAEAKQSWADALAAIDALPERLQKTPAVQTLDAQARAALARPARESSPDAGGGEP
jgi:predicted Zn-dependent protease